MVTLDEGTKVSTRAEGRMVVLDVALAGEGNPVLTLRMRAGTAVKLAGELERTVHGMQAAEAQKSEVSGQRSEVGPAPVLGGTNLAKAFAVDELLAENARLRERLAGHEAGVAVGAAADPGDSGRDLGV